MINWRAGGLGSKGEQLAYDYIIGEFTKAGLLPKGDELELTCRQFEVADGKAVNHASHFIINGNDLKMEAGVFSTFWYCPNFSMEATAAIALNESGGPWFYDLKEDTGRQ